MQSPTPRQLDVLGLISMSLAERGYAPTFRELAEQLGGLSTNAIADHFALLERKALIERDFRTARGIRLTALGHAALKEARTAEASATTGRRPLPSRRNPSDLAFSAEHAVEALDLGA